MKNVFVVLLMALMLCWAGVASADIKIAVVNIPALVAKAPQTKAARTRMEQKFAARRDKLQAMQKSLVEDAKKLQRNASVMSAEARADKEAELRNRQRDFEREQGNYNEDVSSSAREEEEKMRKLIAGVIDSVVKQGGYDLVLSDGILYAEDKINITQQVLEKLKQQN